jgi:ribosomal protein S18 acetylase RimI-like enzyme
VRREILAGYELDDDRDRIDAAAVHRYLSEDAYWALGRSRQTVDMLLRTSHRVLGLFHDGRQVGFCRAVSDGVVHAYLADVYVLPEHRGKGLGEAMVREMLDGGGLAGARWLLHTRDMQRLYRKFGFDHPSERVMERGAGPPPA